MKNSEIIHEFIEGRLPKEMEDKLFMLLSSNDDMRQELKQSIAIDKAFSRKVSTFVPSAAATAGVFSALGITSNASAASASIAGATKTGSAFFAKYGALSMIGMAAAALTSVMFLMFYHPSGGTKALSGDALTNKTGTLTESDIDNVQKPEFTPPVENKNIPLVNCSENDQSGQSNVKTIIKYIYLDKNEIADQKIAASDNIEPDINENTSEMNKEDQITYSSRFLNQQYEGSLSGNKIDGYETINTDQRIGSISSNTNLGFIFELRGSQYWMLPSAGEFNTTTSLFNNTAISLFYKISDVVSVGLDLRKEKFYQEFQLAEGEDVYLYKQYPNYLTLAGGINYNLLRVDNFTGFGRTLIGWAQTGYLGRQMLGVEYSASPSISFMLAGEGTVFYFKQKNKWFPTNKIGLIYGVGIHF